MMSPVSSRARKTSSWSMWLDISTPSNPASLMAFIFSRVEPLIPTVPHMIAFFSDRLGVDAGDSGCFSSTAGKVDDNAQSASAPLAFMKSRRFMEIDLHEFRLPGHGHYHRRSRGLP